MAGLRENRLFPAFAVVALAGAGGLAAAQSHPHGGHGAAPSPARNGAAACPDAHRPSAGAPAGEASVEDLARLLHGTWVRRLTIGGVPVETNSFWYFDMTRPDLGHGRALMIDRVNQGWDDLDSVTAPRPTGSGPMEPADPGLHAAATTGAYWWVKIRPAEAGGGLTMALTGDYRGTGPEYPAAGLRFTESGTFYRSGGAYATRQPWRAPPMAPAAATSSAERFTPVDAVVATPGESNRPTLTFILCKEQIIDRYYKVSSDTPTVEGKSLRLAWDSALASGMFRIAPAP